MTPQTLMQKFKKPFSHLVKIRLRTKMMVVLVLTVWVSLAVVFTLALRIVTVRFDEIAQERITDALHRIEHELNLNTDEVTGKLEKIAQIVEVKRKMLVKYESNRIDYLGLTNQLIDMMRSTGLDLLEITDRNGVIIASAHESAKIGQSKANDTAIQTALTGKNVKTMTIEPLITGTYLALKASVPIYYNNEVIGVLTGGYLMNADFLQRLRRVSPAEIGLVRENNLEFSTLVDEQGHPIRQLQMSPEFLSAIRSSKTPLIKRTTLNQTEYSLGGMPLISNNKAVGIILVAVSQAKMQQTIAELNRAFLELAIVGMILALIIAYLLSIQITAPVQKLAEGAVAIAAGDYDQQIPITTRDELGMLVSSFNFMAKELRENREKLIAAMRLAEWREAARRIAHEIKNPLTPIQLSIQNLQRSHAQHESDFDKVFQESAQTILEEVDALRKIVNEFSEYARLPEPEREWIDLPEVLESTATLYSAGHENINVELDFAKEIPKIFADPEQLRRVFSNLIKNAIDAMQNGGKLTISVARTTMENMDTAALKISFTDTGEGINPETLKKLFIPYFSTKKKGTGLGLAMVERIITEHSGMITVTSVVDQGSTFTIIIPVNYEKISNTKNKVQIYKD